MIETLYEIYGALLISWLFMAMWATPFAIWAGTSTYAATLAGDKAYPGHGRTFWFCLLPILLMLYGQYRGYDNRDPAFPYIADENGQMLFLLVPPGLGLMCGYLFGLLRGLAKRNS